MRNAGSSDGGGHGGDARAVALWCAANGWPIHPLRPGRKTPPANCPSCRTTAHAPESCPCHRQGRWCHGFHSATVDRFRIEQWWGEHGAWGVGVSCGPAGLVVVDIDAHTADLPDRSSLLPGIDIDPRVDLTGLATGFDTLALLAAYRGQQNPAEDRGTLRVRTPSGGLHVWYRVPSDGSRYRSSAGSSGRVALAWQVDIRARNGYVVAPGISTSAGRYQAVEGARAPAMLPVWLAEELVRTGHAITEQWPSAGRTEAWKGSPAVVRHPLADAAAAKVLPPLLADVAACGAVPQGAGFTEKLNRAAYTAGGLVAAGFLDEGEARRLLITAADGVRPTQRARNARIVSAALLAGARRPLRVNGLRSGPGSP